MPVTNARYTLAVILAATLIAGCSGGQHSSPSPPTSPPTGSLQIASLGATNVTPFQPLTVSGSGFDTSGGSAISLIFKPENGAPSLTVPVIAVTSNSVEAAVPPFFDFTSGSAMSTVVDVQVVQVSSSTVSTSNLITGLQVGALPPVPAGVPAGALTALFLQASLNISASPQMANLGPAVTQYTSVLSAVISAANQIAS